MKQKNQIERIKSEAERTLPNTKKWKLKFIPSSEALPPVGEMVLVLLVNAGRYQICLGIRTGMKHWEQDGKGDTRWLVFKDPDDGFQGYFITEWHSLPNPVLPKCKNK